VNLEQDTIVAVATPAGRGGIGVVRLSGPLAAGAMRAAMAFDGELKARVAHFTRLVEPETAHLIDEAVVTFFPAPHSYTGEDVVEIAAHGSPVVLQFLMEQALAAGVRLARAGEFTERAFLNGRLDLTQAEAVRDLIEASTLQQARLAAEQLGGALSRRIAPAKEALVRLIAGLEAGIDFAEDDIDVMPTSTILAAIAEIEPELKSLEASFHYGRILHAGLTLAIVGEPNAGKSSLFNRLLDRDRAIVTAKAGTTRDLISEKVSIDGIPVELIDTAGLRLSDDEAESLGIEKTRETMATADLVLLVTDASRALSPEEEAILRGLEGRPHLLVRNKSDLASVSGLSEGILTSALTGAGVLELREAIAGKVQRGTSPEAGLLTNLRQHEAVVRAVGGLGAARLAVEGHVPHEMLLLDLYACLRGLDELTGATTADDVLNLIFSTFCIGK
jgi:tRNA modification GTPase